VIVVEGPLQSARVERTWGLLDGWVNAPGDGAPGEEIAAAMVEVAAAREPAARVRVIENGPLLVRLLAEDVDGRVRQYDFYADQPGWEWATSAPVARATSRLRPAPWTDAVALFAGEEAATRRPLDAAGTGLWAARLRADGLALAALCPDGPARHALAPDRHEVSAEPGVSRLAWWLLRTDATPEAPEALRAHLDALVAALRQPPAVQLGPVEERRAREF
jgi:hypothetical protein